MGASLKEQLSAIFLNFLLLAMLSKKNRPFIRGNEERLSIEKKKREILSSSESRTFRQTFIVGVLIIFTQEERNLYVWNFVYQIA